MFNSDFFFVAMAEFNNSAKILKHCTVLICVV